ncbi:AEC family transporter [Aliidiomarina halalkaliphila]|uniref:AEC family transporter n=1 Tax=Aliidiomarina halalkaliphila TaxID=2593535 RepID=A0A552X1V8_9GAMM|nr:AEC family transporter [Aliidiomarina halalkaliphila]TRW49022.1 AEC family transporter [Aliidiomarina halalkaliphila]
MAPMLLILAFLAVGLVLKRTGAMPENTGQVLNQYVIYVAVPAMILLHLPHLQLSMQVLTPALMPCLLYPIAIALVWGCAKLFDWSRELTGALMIIVPLGNTSFLGFPMVEVFFGVQGLPYAVIYDQIGSFVGLAFFATFIAAVYGMPQGSSASAKKPRALALIKQLLTFPPVIALVLALTIGQQEYPSVIQDFIEILAATLVPVVMIAVGFQLQFRIPRDDALPFAIAMVIKLFILPAVALATIVSTGQLGLAGQISVFEAAMPFMITAGAVAIGAGLKPRLVASLVGYGVLAGLITLPIWAWIIGMMVNAASG